jgi:hypothetical protein
MKRNFLTSLLVLASLASPALTVDAQAPRGRAAAAAAQQPAAQALPLPASDAVVLVELRRLLTEAMPRVLEGDAARAAQVNADIEQFKARTGIDARAFETLAVGSRLVQLESGATKLDHVVAIARGAFDPAAVVAAGRAAPGATYSAQQHGGKTVHVFGVNDQLKLFGLLRLRVSELGVAALDANTLAVGEPSAVRAAIDAQAGRGRVDAALLNPPRTADDLVVFAGKVPPTTLAGIDVGLPEVNKSIASIRGFHGALAMMAGGFQMTTVLRSATAPDAQRLGKTVEALRSIAPGLLSTAGERGRMARAAVESLKITTQGTDVQLRVELAQGDVASLLRAL